jgi:YHS domain-containing protein
MSVQRWVVVWVVFLFSAMVGAQPIALNKEGIAIDGYDPVAYFVHNKAVKGKPEFALLWEGTTYHFESLEHMRIFAYEPPRYVPQYGGYCAYGVARGAKPLADPTAFTVRDGKLYLNRDANVRKEWLVDANAHIAAADRHWLRIASGK